MDVLCIAYRVSCSQILWYLKIQCLDSGADYFYITTNYVKTAFDPVTKVYQLLFTFYCTIDKVYAEYTGLFSVSLLRSYVSSAATLWNESRAGIRPLIIWFVHNAWREDSNILLVCGRVWNRFFQERDSSGVRIPSTSAEIVRFDGFWRLIEIRIFDGKNILFSRLTVKFNTV